MLSAVEQELGIRVPLQEIFECGSIERLAGLLRAESARSTRHLVRIQNQSGRPHLFLIHPIGGNLLCYSSLIRSLKGEFSVHGFQSSARDQDRQVTIGSIAETYIRELKSQQSNGPPYLLVGWSFGALVGFEMASRLAATGEAARVVMIDPWLRPWDAEGKPHERTGDGATRATYLNGLLHDLLGGVGMPMQVVEGSDLAPATGEVLTVLQQHDERFRSMSQATFDDLFAIYVRNRNALMSYRAPANSQPVFVLAAGIHSANLKQYLRPFAEFISGHEDMVTDCRIDTLADHDHYSIIASAKAHELIREALRSFTHA